MEQEGGRWKSELERGRFIIYASERARGGWGWGGGVAERCVQVDPDTPPCRAILYRLCREIL